MGQAELWFGAGRGARHAVVCLIGSGVGASIITSRNTHQGSSSAAEWGHTTIVVGGRACRCGSRGCLEAYIGAEAILDRFGHPLPGDDEESALAALIDLAATSSAAEQVLAETALYVGVGIADLINLISPERIILGGWAGLLLGERLLPAIREAARQHSLRHPFPGPRSSWAAWARRRRAGRRHAPDRAFPQWDNASQGEQPRRGLTSASPTQAMRPDWRLCRTR